MRNSDEPMPTNPHAPVDAQDAATALHGAASQEALHEQPAPAAESMIRLLGYTVLYIGADIERDLRDIERNAGRNNPRAGITGVLLFDAGRFIQVIEGPDRSIDELLARIARDPRAAKMHILFDTHVTHRSTDSWALWVARLDHEPPFGTSELDRFRAMYERGFRLDAAGFMTLLLQLIRSA